MYQNNKVKVAVIQSSVGRYNESEHITHINRYIEECSNSGCQLICFPEAFLTGLNIPNMKYIAQSIPGDISDWLCSKAKQYKVYISAGIAEKEGELYYSSSVLISPDGKVILKYRRIHRFSFEKNFIDRGDECAVVDTMIGRIGMILGYDINFPEITRQLFLQQVDIIICPAQMLNNFTPAIQQLVLARATENSCYMIFCSSVGGNSLANLIFMGNSFVARSHIGLNSYDFSYIPVEPVIAKAGEVETVLSCELDLSQLHREKMENPHYQDAVLLHSHLQEN